MKYAASFPNEAWDFEIDTQENSSANLPYSIVKQICRFLPTQHDRYVACFIHPSWLAAATDVLWESPEIRHPDTLPCFVQAVKSSKRSALSVRHLNLCVHDTIYPTLFKPIVHSTLKRHMIKTIPLSNPQIILFLARQCEKLKSLTIYGWNIERTHLEQLAAILGDINSLRIIGNNSNIKQPFEMITFLPNLTNLTLDGDFVLTQEYTATIASRCHKLVNLQLSLKNVSINALAALCSGQLQLEHLVLTDASELNDGYVTRILGSFPRLSYFGLQGTSGITTEVLNIALTKCSELTTLDIRANSFPPTDTKSQPLKHLLKLRHLLIHNMPVDDSRLTYYVQYIPDLISLGLSRTEVTDVGITTALSQLEHLQALDLTHCNKITGQILKAATRLRQVYLDTCGHFSPSEIYHYALESTPRKLRNMCINGYPKITNVFSNIGSSAPRETNTLILDHSGLKRLLNMDISHEPSLMPTPASRNLSGHQIVLLARRLNMSLEAMEAMLDEIQNEKPNSVTESAQMLGQVSRTTSVQRPLGGLETKKSVSRIAALKPNFRPETPALWEKADKSVLEDCINDTKNAPANMREVVPSVPHTPSKTPQPYVRDQSSPYPEDVLEGTQEEWPLLNNSTSPKEETSLGGWGSGREKDWLGKPNTPTTKHLKAPKPFDPKIHPEWSQVPLQVTNTKHIKHTKPEAAGDGWGSALTYRPWTDLGQQGFAHEVLEEQKNTKYWNAEKNKWETAPTVSNVESHQTINKIPAKVQKIPSRPASSLAPTKPRSAFDEPNDRDLSPDEDIDLDFDDGVIIKTSNETTHGYQSRLAKKEPKPPPKHPGSPKWQTMKEWQDLKESSPIDNTSQEPLESRFSLTLDEGWGEATPKKTERFSRPTSGTEDGPTVATPVMWSDFKQRAMRPPAQGNKFNSQKVSRSRPTSTQYFGQEQLLSESPKYRQETKPAPSTNDVNIAQLIDTSEYVFNPVFDITSPKTTVPAIAHIDSWRDLSSLSIAMMEDKPDQIPQKDPAKISTKDAPEFMEWDAQQEKSDSTDDPTQTLSDQSRSSTPTETEINKPEDMLGGNETLLPLETCLEPTHPTRPSSSISTFDITAIASPSVQRMPLYAATNKPVQTADIMSSIPVLRPDNEPIKPQEAAKSIEKDAEPEPLSTEGLGKKMLQVQVETTKFGKQDLTLYENRDPALDVKKFCEKYEMSDHVDKILDTVLDSYIKKKTKLILGKKKRPKTTSS
ncbi:hypothetical protein CLU79DRAFT_751754 [Phycomyces nitens]|nr:hypothetical protein CLU79DRAFT_751754 [Phycomyces nitens]